MLNPDYGAIIIQSTLSEVFQYLNIHGFWNFLNYYLIEELIMKFSKSMQEKIMEYETKLSTFRQETKLSDFLQVWPMSIDETPYVEMGKVITKLQDDWAECTLQDVVDTQMKVAAMFDLNRFLFNFCKGKPGCVELTWLVPQPVLKYMKELIKNMPRARVRNADEVIMTPCM